MTILFSGIKKRKIIIKIGIGILLFLIIIYARVIFSARRQYLEAQKALKRGELTLAIRYFKHTAQFYAPLNPYPKSALKMLWNIGKKAEFKGKPRIALLAYRGIRTSILSTRSLYTPYPTLLQKANKKISYIMARQASPPIDKKKTVSQIQQEYELLLARDESPSPFWSFIVVIGFLGWIGFTFCFIFKAFEKDERFNKKKGIIWGSLSLGSFIIWLLGLWMA